MVFILHRYLFRELMKVFLLSTVGLTVILTFGSLLRPIQEYGIGPEQVVSLLGYFVPITLTFVLPVAALFAASLVYGRFASDNEFDACRASGISVTMLLYPGLVLAIVVSIANLILSFHVVPAYVHHAETAIKSDAKQILFRNIQRQGYYTLPGSDLRIYADAADIQNSTLAGVVIVDTRPGKAKLTTAETAKITFQVDKYSNSITIAARNTFRYDQHGGFSFATASGLYPFESMMTENVKFQKIGQMNAIKKEPINYYPIAVSAWNCYERLTIEMLAKEIKEALTNGAGFYELASNKKLLRITAESAELGTGTDVDTIIISGNAALFDYDRNTGELSASYRGNKIFLSLAEQTEGRPINKLLLKFPNAVWLDRGTEYMKPLYSTSGLDFPESLSAKLGENITETVETHPFLPEPSDRFNSLVKEMKRKTMVTLMEIKAEIHSRLVFGIGCIVLITTAMGLGIKVKGGHLLTAFGVSAVPAAILMIFIMMGKNMTTNQASAADANVGVMFMWGGLAFLAIASFVLYRKLMRS